MNTYKDFELLREQYVQKTTDETIHRIRENPVPQEIELYIGAFIESIEEQVREAVITFITKGYNTESSGFYGDRGEIQQIDGYFSIDSQTKEKLRALDVTVMTGTEAGYWGDSFMIVHFKPKTADITEITNKWNQIADILPDLHVQGISTSGASEEFRFVFAPERRDIQLLTVQKLISQGKDAWDPVQWETLHYRLKKLKALEM